MDMLMTPNPGNLILTKPTIGILMLMTPTSGNLILTTCTPGNMMLTTPTLMKESDIDDTQSGEYDVNNTRPYERIWCWRHPPQGICFWWHPPWESDVDDTHIGESDVKNNAPPPPGPRESDVDDANPNPQKIRHWKNFLMEGIRSRLCWIKSMTFFSHSSLQRTFGISANSSRSNQRENMLRGKGYILKWFFSSHSPQKVRQANAAGVQRTLFTGHKLSVNQNWARSDKK